MAIKLPTRNYFTFPELMRRWECEENDIRHLILNGDLKPSYVINHVANVVRFLESEDENGQYWLPDQVENDVEHESEEDREAFKYKMVSTEGFYYLLYPDQTASLECNFIFFSKDRNHLRGFETTCLMHTFGRAQPNPISLTDVMKNGAVMMSEIALFESDAPKLQGVCNGGSIEADIDPADLPTELDAANIAYRAVMNGRGDKSATFKNRLIDYLEKNFTGLNGEAVQRIATVANPDKGRGRKKINAE